MRLWRNKVQRLRTLWVLLVDQSEINRGKRFIDYCLFHIILKQLVIDQIYIPINRKLVRI